MAINFGNIPDAKKFDFGNIPETKKYNFGSIPGKSQEKVESSKDIAEILGKTTEISAAKPFYHPDKIKTQLKRKLVGMPALAAIGDIPFVGKALRDIDLKPRSGFERFQFTTGRLSRDLFAISKVAALKGLPFLLGSGAFGAATSSTEDPLKIAKEAAKGTATFGIIKGATTIAPKVIRKSFSWAFNKLPPAAKERVMRVGSSIGLSLKRIPQFAKLKFQRYSDIKLSQIRAEELARSMEKDMSPQQLEALTIFMEKKIPRKLVAQKPHILDILKQSEQRVILNKWSKQLRTFYNEGHQQMTEIYGDDVGFVKNYVNRLWKIPQSKQQQVTKWFMTRPSNLKKRLIDTIKDGMDKFNLEPETLNAAELMRYYNTNVATATANMRLVQGIKGLKSVDGKSMVMRADKAPVEWGAETVIDHPVMRRAMFVGKKGRFPILSKIPVKVNPEIAEEMKTIFSTVDENAIGRAVDGLNAFAKHSQLSLSFFHHVALAESALAVGLNPAKIMLKSIKGMKKGDSPVLRMAQAQDGIKHGLGIGAPTDIHRNLVESSLLAAENVVKKSKFLNIKGMNIVTPARALIQKNNRFLWDYYHPNMKIFAYEKLTQDALKMEKFANLPTTAVKREVAQFVNDTFGGQAWSLMTKSARWQKNMQRTLLSPDWTLSTIRQAVSPFGAGARDSVTKELRAELGQEFWKTGGIIMYGSINNLNRAFTQFYYGQPRDMLDNAPGKQTNLFVGFHKDGTERYARFGKQFRELPEFFFKQEKLQPLGAPIAKIAGKLSPALQIAKEQIRPYPYGELGQSIGTERETGERIKSFGKTFLPFSVQTQIQRQDFSPLSFALPVSKGATYFNTIENFKTGIRRNDLGYIDRVFKAAIDNELNAKDLLKKAQSEVEYEKAGGFKEAMKAWIQIKDLPQNQWKSTINSMNLNEKTRKSLSRLIRDKLATGQLRDELKEGTISARQILNRR